MKYIFLLSVILIAGCATQPTPKSLSHGHHADQHDKMMFYKAPEEIWPEDFPPAPKVCGSPFTGKLIAR